MRITIGLCLVAYHFCFVTGFDVEGFGLDELNTNLLQKYKGMKTALMLNVNNSLSVVNLKHVPRPSAMLTYWPFYNLSHDLTFYYFNKELKDHHVQFSLANITALLKTKGFDPNKKTLVLVHGYLNDVWSPMVQLSVNASYKYLDVNVLALDWYQVMANINSIIFSWCAEATLPVGNALGQSLDRLMDLGLKPNLIHMVGHSLGAHVVGIAGKYLKTKNRTVSRISGLDPARIEFEDVPPSQRIDATDAKFVDCIHTCGGYLGFERPLCQADFYPNGGSLQPGCSITGDMFCVCSHGRSYRYFAESIIPNHRFPTSVCAWTFRGLMGCSNSSQLMGYPATKEYLGVFWAQTEPQYPFSPTAKHPYNPSWWDQFTTWLMSFSIIST